MFTKFIDRFNPGITLLVLLWVVAFAVRQRLAATGMLAVIGDEALTSLLYVIPIMLAGWAILAAVDHVFGLGFLSEPPNDADDE